MPKAGVRDTNADPSLLLTIGTTGPDEVEVRRIGLFEELAAETACPREIYRDG